MPPTGVLMSTCLSSPFFSFFTLMLHAARRSNIIADPRHIKLLVLPKLETSASDLYRPLYPGATLRDVGYSDRKMATNWNLAEERFYSRNFRHGRVGERAHVVFDLGEVARQVGISHGDHGSFCRRIVEQLLQKRLGGICHCHGVSDLARGWYHIDRRNDGFRFVECLQNFVAHTGCDPRIHINHACIRDASAKLAPKGTARFGAHVV